MSEPIFNTEEEALEWQAAQIAIKLQKIKEAKAAKELEEKNRLAEIARLEEIERKKNQKFTIRVDDISSQRMVTVHAEFNTAHVEILRMTPGRTYTYGGFNSIPLDSWESYKADVLSEIENAEFTFASPELEAKLIEKLNEPIWEVSLSKYALAVRTRSHDSGTLYRIPGTTFSQGVFYVPRSEGWQLFTSLSTKEKVKWTDEALAFVQEQLEKRARLDAIATMERGEKFRDFSFDVNGVKVAQLRVFQEIGCEFIDATGGRCLLADDMGLGKSIQALAYAVKNNLRTLIVCPASLKNNWSKHVKNLTGRNAYVLRGAEPTKIDTMDLIFDDVRPFTIINYDILARKNEFTKETFDQEGHKHIEHQIRFPWAEVLSMAKFDFVIYDEAHYFKNTESNRWQAIKTFDTPHVLPMTGTPVLNRPGEYWPLLNKINPLMFPAHDTFLAQYTYDGKTAKNVEELRNTLKTMMIRRLQKDVKKDLPPINRINEYYELTPKAKKLYEKVLAGIYETINNAGENVEKEITNILVQIQRLKQVCAIDKTQATADLAANLYDQTDESEHRKVLIFSQYKMTAHKIAQLLGHEALSFVYRSGASGEFVTIDNTERFRMVEEFQTNPKIKYLVVTEKTTKEGHDITAAGHVIFNDLFWTPAAHQQAEGRAYGRESDSHNINSYYMITDMDGKSIDEWIMTLLADKLRMIDEIVEGVEGARDVSIASELIRKFRDSMGER